jgi:phosphotransferase system HPr-like phosphotransfer protein
VQCNSRTPPGLMVTRAAATFDQRLQQANALLRLDTRRWLRSQLRSVSQMQVISLGHSNDTLVSLQPSGNATAEVSVLERAGIGNGSDRTSE